MQAEASETLLLPHTCFQRLWDLNISLSNQKAVLNFKPILYFEFFFQIYKLQAPCWYDIKQNISPILKENASLPLASNQCFSTKLLHECISFVTLGYRQLRAQRQNKSFFINVLTKFVQIPTAMQHCIHMLRYRCPEQKSLSCLLEKWLIKYSENCF